METASFDRSRVMIGRCLAVLAVIGWLLALAAEVGGLPSRLQSAITANSAVWSLASGALLVAGIRLLWLAGHGQPDWQPEVPGMRFETILIYSRPDCCLCEKATELLLRYRAWIPTPLEVNIDDDPELQARFDESVPVIEIDGRIRFRGCVSEVLLQRLIEGTPPIPTLRHR